MKNSDTQPLPAREKRAAALAAKQGKRRRSNALAIQSHRGVFDEILARVKKEGGRK